MASDPLADVALERLPLLESLPAEVRAQVRRRFVRATQSFGAVIVREGEPADALYVLTSGRARVVKRGDDGEEVPLNVLRAGDVFGEMALLERTTRTATVRASSDVEVWRLDRAVFDELLVTWPDLKKHLELQASLSCGDGEALLDYDPTAGTSTVLLGPTVNGGSIVDALVYPGYE